MSGRQSSKGKSRMISIRLTDDEYQAIKSQYGGANELSVSDFARSALMHFLASPSPDPLPAVQALLIHLRDRVDRLESRVDTIIARNQLLVK